MNYPTTSNITSIDAYKKYGVLKSQARFAVINVLNLYRNYRSILAYYKCLHWTPTYTLEAIHNGTIVRDGITFCVVFHGCTRYDITKAKEVLLSFRTVKPEYDLAPYVLVKPYTASKRIEGDL